MYFANVNDFYFSRQLLIGEDEINHIDPKRDDAGFRQWFGDKPHGKGYNYTFTQIEAELNGEGLALWSTILEEFLKANKQEAKSEGFASMGNTGPDGVSLPVPNYIVPGRTKTDLDAALSFIKDKGASAFDHFTDTIFDVARRAAGADGWSHIVKTPYSKLTGDYLAARQAQDIGVNLRKLLSGFLQYTAGRTSTLPTYPRPNSRLQPVRKWHLISSSQIVANNIALNERIFNAVKVNKTVYAASKSIPSVHRRVLDCDPLIIDIQDNVHGMDLDTSYAQSFLREDVSKMYKGELVLLGTPEIDPNDVIMLFDTQRGIVGPVEVESVLHSVDLEMGFVTIVKPRAMVLINESASAGMCAALSGLMSEIATDWDQSVVRSTWQGMSGQEKVRRGGGAIKM